MREEIMVALWIVCWIMVAVFALAFLLGSTIRLRWDADEAVSGAPEFWWQEALIHARARRDVKEEARRQLHAARRPTAS